MTAETKAEAEALIPQFRLDRLLNQDQNGRRIALLGTIASQPALITLERAAFPSDPSSITALLASLAHTTNLGANDIYRWYLASTSSVSSSPPHLAPDPTTTPSSPTPCTAIDTLSPVSPPPNRSVPPPTSTPIVPPLPSLKLNLIYPCTPSHVKKYSTQRLRMVTETPQLYAQYVRPYMRRCRDEGRLNWVFNILEGRTEQEDVILRYPGGKEVSIGQATASEGTRAAHRSGSNRPGNKAADPNAGSSDDYKEDDDEAFLLLPDLNWDRKTPTSLHLLALVARRDLWSLRDLRKRHVPWLRRMRASVLEATGRWCRVEKGWEVDGDELKVYVHYQPTYYHFHIHVVHVLLEAGTTQATGKAFGLENLIAQLETLAGNDDDDDDDGAGLADVDLTYFLGEASPLWDGLFRPLKEGRRVGLLD